MRSLPTELIADVLSRQPVKSLLRFRCVSKHWCSLIDGPDFVKLHLQRSTRTDSDTNLIVRHEKFIHSLDLESEKFVELDHPLKSPTHATELLGSCNGLVCLSNPASEVVLWNPSTRRHHVLPVLPTLSSSTNVEFGFGYDRVNDDYKVMRIDQRHGVHPKSEVGIYSLNLDSWKKIDDFPYQLCYRRDCGVFVSGALHYTGSRSSDLNDLDVIVIVAFDLDVERFELLPTPQRVENHFVMLHLGVLGGSLCVISNFIRCDIHMWVMKDYGTKVWTKLLCFTPELSCYNLAFVSPLAYSKSGHAVLLGRELPEPEAVKLIWYDLEKKRLKLAKFQGEPKSFDVATESRSFVTTPFVGSLVPLKAGRKKKIEPEEKKKKKKKNMKRDDFLSAGFKLVL